MMPNGTTVTFFQKAIPACKKVPPNLQVFYRFCPRITFAAGRNDRKPVILMTLFHIVERINKIDFKFGCIKKCLYLWYSIEFRFIFDCFFQIKSSFKKF